MEMGPIGDTVYGVHQGHASPLYQDLTHHTVDRYTTLAEGATRRHLQPVMTVVPMSDIPGVCEMRY